MQDTGLEFVVEAECPVSKARACKVTFARHGTVSTPVFMPVGTQGTLKALTPDQLANLGCEIMLANTYHLGHRPGPDLVEQAGGLHEFAQWKRGYLTDSGGFQMVSLVELSSVTEEGVQFKSPHDSSDMLLTPEHSIAIQNKLGADIAMQLDDVVHSSTRGQRVVEAMHRSIRWLDRCIAAHGRRSDQALFAILQGGLDPELRKQCTAEMVKRKVSGFAIGGLSGGEEKELFWPTVSLCTDLLPRNLPRYLMGVGYAEDLVVCVALGCDMFDCVFPTRTARFGVALNYHSPSATFTQLLLNRKQFARDASPIITAPEDFSEDAKVGVQGPCNCMACANGVTRSAIFSLIAARHPTACQLLTSHNVASQLRLMRDMRQAIIGKRFPAFVQTFFRSTRPTGPAAAWVKAALASVSIVINN